ncbi:uncharacterized protein DS421_10g309230 [Arachis hypogaea]|nr:uncharacterized protein DS421_10g309230 [Arachis hypogaea]
MEYSYLVAAVSFEEARFYGLEPTTMDDDDVDDEGDDRIRLNQTTLPFQDLMLCKSVAEKARTIKDYFCSYTPKLSFEEARFFYGPQGERRAKAEKKLKSKALNALKKATRVNKLLLKTAIKNSMVKKGGIEAMVAEDVFDIIKPRKQRGFDRTRFKIRASKLGVCGY